MDGKGISVQINVWTPEYYRYLYEQMLKEMKEFMVTLSIPKWKRDVLILLLMKSKETFPSNKKKLRREVDKELNKIIKAWSH